MKNSCQPAAQHLHFHRRVKGFTLIELLISITMGLVIIASLVGVLVTASSNSKTNDRTSEIQENGRYALELLKRDIRQAGFRGYNWGEPNPPSAAITIPANPGVGDCGPGFAINIRQGIWGANDTNPFSGTCIPAANYANGDVLVIRHVANAPTPAASAPAPGSSTLSFYSTYSTGVVFQGTNGLNGVLSDPYFAMQVYVYYISPYTNSPAESPQIPALYRVALQPDGSMLPELVVSGIEKFQVQYGRTTTDLNTQYYNADQINGTSINTTPSDWDSVSTVRIWVLARNSKVEPGYTNTATYVMGDQSYTVNDGYRRQLFSTVIQRRNSE